MVEDRGSRPTNLYELRDGASRRRRGRRRPPRGGAAVEDRGPKAVDANESTSLETRLARRRAAPQAKNYAVGTNWSDRAFVGQKKAMEELDDEYAATLHDEVDDLAKRAHRDIGYSHGFDDDVYSYVRGAARLASAATECHRYEGLASNMLYDRSMLDGHLDEEDEILSAFVTANGRPARSRVGSELI